MVGTSLSASKSVGAEQNIQKFSRWECIFGARGDDTERESHVVAVQLYIHNEWSFQAGVKEPSEK